MYTETDRAVLDKLLRRFGSRRLSQVEQLSEHGYRARLVGGEIVLAMAAPDGAVAVWTPEGPECGA